VLSVLKVQQAAYAYSVFEFWGFQNLKTNYRMGTVKVEELEFGMKMLCW
jgi:hypothetical protein